jgi:glycosyltransferase involved in cell wall biosynthesis
LTVVRRKIRVCALFLHNSVWGVRIRGDERRFLEIAKRLVRYGADLHVIEFSPSLQNSYYRANVYNSLQLRTRRLSHTITWLIMLAFRLKDCDVIYAYNQDLLNILASLIFKLIQRKPLIIVVQSIQDLEFSLKSLRHMYGAGVLDLILLSLYRYLLLPVALRLANVTFTVSNTLKARLILKYPWLRGKTYVSLNGVDLNKFKPINLRKEYDAIYLGRMHIQHKGLDKLLLAWKQIVRKQPKATLVLAGGFESERDKKLIFNLIDKLSLKNNVIVTGFIEDEEIVQLLNKAKVFISLSAYEGFGLTILEALACGLPVITTNLDVFRELHGNMLFYVPRENLKDLIMLLDKHIHDNTIAHESLVKALRNHARSFSWNLVACKEFIFIKKS